MFVLRLQELIHKFEEGSGARAVRWVFLAAAFAGLAVFYDAACFRNMATEEAMDAAQLARNLAEGKGFTTQVVQPLGIYLLARHRADHSALLKEGHPDLANPPVYPLLLAPVVKWLPEQNMWLIRNFTVARGDLVIAIFNQAVLLVSLFVVYRLARRWFDRGVAGMAALLFALTELYWRFSISGLSTNVAMLLLLLFVLSLAWMEDANRTANSAARTVAFALLSGALLGMLTLTKYSCGLLIVPALLYSGSFMAPRRGAAIAALGAAFLVVVSPWVTRNIIVSGAPFGTAGFAIVERTRVYSEGQLHRTLHPNLRAVPVGEYVRKLIVEGRDVVASDLPRMGGSWIWAFFIAGLLVPFRSTPLLRGRWFVILALATLLPVQALGKTQNWAEVSEVNGDNLLVLLSPLVLIYGVGAFFVLLDSFQFSMLTTRYAAWAAFAAVMSLPLILTLVPPHPFVIAYPPYYPPFIQKVGSWMEPGNTAMTDVPAALAWYGRRQAIMLTSRRESFTEIHDYQKAINALYLTPRTTDARGLGPWLRGEKDTWQGFLVDLKHGDVPSGFPLRAGQDHFAEGQVLLMDYDRWRSVQKK